MGLKTEERLETLRADGRYRTLRITQDHAPTFMLLDGKPVHIFSSNDYLGLATDPIMKKAIAEAGERYGMGPRAAALICGYTDEHHQLESELARLKQTETALLFPTGFQANLGILSALGSDETDFFSDALNHASIIDGCRLARGQVRVYQHRDITHLNELLSASDASTKVVVTDAVFSMDGTLAPLPDLVKVAQRHDATLVLDEAHSTLVFGQQGGGVAEHFGLADQIDFHVGTLSKAVGAHGGFIATSTKHRQWLLNTARSYVFTTALPLPIVCAARAGLAAATSERRSRLWQNVRVMSQHLSLELHSPIVPIVLGDEARTMTAAAALFDAGFHVGAIRPPTVPRKTSRLRITLSAAHTAAQIEALAGALKPYLRA